jgi:hypothetical protein
MRWRSYVACLVLTMGSCACKHDSLPESAPSSTASAGSVASQPPTALAPVDPRAKKNVTPRDCEEWAEHGASVVVSSIVAASAACPTQAREDIRKKFQDDIVSIRSGANSLCGNHVDESYVAADASCFMNATDALVMRACRFAPMTNPGDSDWESIIKTMRERCAVVSQATGAGGDSPSTAPAPSTAKGNGTTL